MLNFLFALLIIFGMFAMLMLAFTIGFWIAKLLNVVLQARDDCFFIIWLAITMLIILLAGTANFTYMQCGSIWMC